MNKKIFRRFAAIRKFINVATMAFLCASGVSSVTAAAVEDVPEESGVSISQEIEEAENTPAPASADAISAPRGRQQGMIVQLADVTTVTTAPAAGDDGSGSYAKVFDFFIKWIRRIGVAVALIGAVMFGFSFKNNDAEQKQNGLMTMASGFIVAAIVTIVDYFDLFS